MANEVIARVDYQLQEADLGRLWQMLSAGRVQRVSLLQVVMTYNVVLPLAPFVVLIAKGRFLEREVLAGYALAVLVSVWFVQHFWRNYRRRFLRWTALPEVRRYLLPTTAELRADGFEVRSPAARSFCAWSSVHRIDVGLDRQSLLFWLGEAMAIMIPVRAFESEHAFDSFIEAANHLRRIAINPQMNCPRCGYDLRTDPDAGCPECGWQRDNQPGR
jgi:hypothetical protein